MSHAVRQNRSPRGRRAGVLAAALWLATTLHAFADSPLQPEQTAARQALPDASAPQTTPQSENLGWLNGTNYQTTPPVVTGPVTWTFLLDTYYGFAFNQPEDHTVFPTSTAPRHGELGLNYGLIGLDVTGVPDLIAKLALHVGHYAETNTTPDQPVQRGSFLGMTSMQLIQQAYVGYHFPVLHGLNVMAGLLPTNIGLESALPQENWTYTYSLPADFAPFIVGGAVAQLFPRPDLKTELWLVNGWQSVSMYAETPGGGWTVHWKPNDDLVLGHNVLIGPFEIDPTRVRFFSDNSLLWRYARQPLPWIKSLAIAGIADLGYTTAGHALPQTWMGGGALTHRLVFDDQWAWTVRGSFFHDPQKLIAFGLPLGQLLPDGDLLAGELTTTLDYKPTPWLLCRLEYRYDLSSIPYVAGPGGITPTGNPDFRPDLRTSGHRLVASTTVRF